MIKNIWLVISILFLMLAIYYFYRATKHFPKPENMAQIKTINGTPLGIHEFIEDFRNYVDKYNQENKISNILSGITSLVACITSIISYLIS